MTERGIVVVADSLAFHGPERPEAADDPRLFPAVLGAALDRPVHLFARMGWTTRDAWWAVSGDPALWSALRDADAVVLAVGGMDYLPTVVPTYLREGIRYVHSDRVRTRLRSAYQAVQPGLAAISRGRVRALPQRLTDAYLSRIVAAIRGVRPDVAVVGILPPPHRAPMYAQQLAGLPPAVSAARAWGLREGVPMADLPSVVGPQLLRRVHNPDGIHFGWPTHAAVGGLLADVVRSCPAWESHPAPQRTV